MIVLPVKVYSKREGDTGDVSRIVGYWVICECGWRTSSRSTVRLARADYRDHRRQEHSAVTVEAVSPDVSAES